MAGILPRSIPAGTGRPREHLEPRARRSSRLPPVYLDASALVKLAIDEHESVEARFFVRGARLVSSELVMAEVPRAIRKKVLERPSFDLRAGLLKAEIILGDTALHPLERLTLWRAGRFFEPKLRSLDAIHVMTALDLRPIGAFMSYDRRQIKAARKAGLPVVSPGMKW